MSVLPFQTSLTGTTDWFVPQNENTTFLSTINVPNGTINTSQINLDDIRMDCAILNSTPTLLLNGVPVASVSSFTSSITTWSSYPALTPITYATGTGTGGAINMANVNALSNVSSLTGTFGTLSTIGGATIANYPYPQTFGTWNEIALPNPPQTVSNLQNGQIVPLDMSGLPNGAYLIVIYIQSGGVDPWTCQFLATKGTTAGVLCTGTHMPSYNPYGTQPTTANMITAQSSSISATSVDFIFFSNGTTPSAGIIGATAQFQMFRLY